MCVIHVLMEAFVCSCSWDSLTISYAVAQGVPAWLCALVNALSAVTGIVRYATLAALLASRVFVCHGRSSKLT